MSARRSYDRVSIRAQSRSRGSGSVWISVAINVAAVLADAYMLSFLQRLRAGTAGDSDAGRADVFVASTVGLQFVAYSVIAIVFLMWLYRARANLVPLGIEDARWKPGWAIAWFFIPIMNYFRPYQVVAELWRASDPTAVPGSWHQRPGSGLLPWWWVLYLVGNVMIWGLVGFDVSTIPELELITGLRLVGAALLTISSILAINIVREIDRRQTQRYSAIRAQVF